MAKAKAKRKPAEPPAPAKDRFTINIDPVLSRWIRIEAAKQGISRINYIEEVLQRHRDKVEAEEKDRLNERYSGIRDMQEQIRQGGVKPQATDTEP